VRRQGRAQVAGLVVREHLRETGVARLDREPVQLPVQLHDLGVLALEELADEVGVDPELGAGAVEAEEVHQHRVHDVEVDLHRALVVAAALLDEPAEVGRRHRAKSTPWK
jgi:hypothetical protein